MHEVVFHSLRGSLLVAGVVMLISGTGGWQYVTNSLQANDLRRAAAWSNQDVLPEVAMVAIDDRGYEQFFDGRSPLNRSKLLQLLQAIDARSPHAKGIILDLDLSPAPGEDQSALLAFFSQNPHRWILAEPVRKASDDTPTRRKWRDQVCAAGIRMGLPHLPTEFGYVVSTRQYHGSLVNVALESEAGCSLLPDPTSQAAPLLHQYPAMMSPSYVGQGLVLPFDGDVNTLAENIASIDPAWIVVGGTWGTSDEMNTPMGERYGAQLHAAALEGHAKNQRQASFAVQILGAWFVVALISAFVDMLNHGIARHLIPWHKTMTGHRFIKDSAWPIAIVLMVVLCLALFSEVLAIIHARWHYWIPSAEISVVTLGALIFSWKWGQHQSHGSHTVAQVWQSTFLQPVKEDWKSMVSAARAITNPSLPMQVEVAGMDTVTVSRTRAAAEFLFVLLSLCGQMILPMWLLLHELFFAHSH